MSDHRKTLKGTKKLEAKQRKQPKRILEKGQLCTRSYQEGCYSALPALLRKPFMGNSTTHSFQEAENISHLQQKLSNTESNLQAKRDWHQAFARVCTAGLTRNILGICHLSEPILGLAGHVYSF